MATKLIINADDLGFSTGITDGILRSCRDGMLTSATLMATMPDRDRAIDLAGAEKRLGVGIHLCLTQGTPLTRCPRILARDGTFFRSLPRLFLKLRSKDARLEAQEEFAAQIQYALARKLPITHLDSHKHVAHIPALHEALIGAALAAGVGWIRCAREASIPGLPAMSVPYRMLARLAAELAGKARAAGLGTTDWFYGLATTGRTDVRVLETLANNAPPGLGELMVHPGFIGDLTPRETRLLQQRVVEMEALCDPRARRAVERTGIAPQRYGA